MGFHLEKDWHKFKALPDTKPDPLIDVGKIQARLDARAGNPLRWKEGSFKLPKGASASQIRNAAQLAANRFISGMAKQGWSLHEKPQLAGPFLARDIDSHIPLLDMDEYRIRAVFKKEGSPERVRTELPPGIIRQDPEQTITMQEAEKALS